MASIFSLYKEIIPPTACNCCAYASFTSPDARNVIISCSSILRIYNTVFTNSNSGTSDQDLSGSDGRCLIPRLELVKEEKLKAVVTSIGVVRPQLRSDLSSETDCIILTFKTAKISLLEWSPSTRSIVTVAIHYYEREEFRKESFVDKIIPEIVVEPQSSCSIMNFYTDKLAVIPFKGDPLAQISDRIDSEYTSIKNIISMTFVSNFFGPMLVVLYESNPVWKGGKQYIKKDTRSLVFVSIDPIQRTHKSLHKVDGLPHNCYKVVAIPPPVGGVIVVSTNALIYVDQTSDPVSVYFNMYYSLETDFAMDKTTPNTQDHQSAVREGTSPNMHLTDMSHLSVSLEGCELFLINPDTFLVVLLTGRVLIVQMIGNVDSGKGQYRRKGGVVKFSVEYTSIFLSSPSCGALIKGPKYIEGVTNANNSNPLDTSLPQYSSRYIFIGSSTADHMLVRIDELCGKPSGSKSIKHKPTMDINISEQEVLKPKNIFDVQTDPPSQNSEDDGYDIYSSSDMEYSPEILQDGEENVDTHNNKQNLSVQENGEPTNEPLTKSDNINRTFFRIQVCDSIVTYSPMRDAVISEPAAYSVCDFKSYLNKTCYSETNPFFYEIVSCTGLGHSGALSIFHRGVKPIVVNTLETGEVGGMWLIKTTLSSQNVNKKSPSDISLRSTNLTSPDIQGDSETSTPEEDSNTTNKKNTLDQDMKIIDDYNTGDTEELINTPKNTETACSQLSDLDMIFLVSKPGQTSHYRVFDGNVTEYTGTDMCVSSKTLDVKHICNGLLIVQVHDNGILILSSNDFEKLSEIKLTDIVEATEGLSVLSCSILDDYVQLLLSNKQVALFEIHAEPVSLKFLSFVELRAKVSCCTLYSDKHLKHRNKFLTEDLNCERPNSNNQERIGEFEHESVAEGSETSMRYSLYSEDSAQNSKNKFNNEKVLEAPEFNLPGENCWCVSACEDGALEIVSIPSMEQRFFSRVFYQKPEFMNDEPFGCYDENPQMVGASRLWAAEIVFINAGRDEEYKDTYMIIRTDSEELVIYRVDYFKDVNTLKLADPTDKNSSTSKIRLCIMFSRLNFEIFCEPPNLPLDSFCNIKTCKASDYRKRITTFEKFGVSGGMLYSGAFVSGNHPRWIMCAESGGKGSSGYISNSDEYPEPSTRVTLLSSPRACGKNVLNVYSHLPSTEVISFCPIYLNTGTGCFCFLDAKFTLYMCNLNKSFNYEVSWPLCKVPIRRTPRKIAYHHTEKLHVVATSKDSPFSLLIAQNNAVNTPISSLSPFSKSEQTMKNKSGESFKISRPKGAYLPTIQSYQLELVSPVNWNTIDVITMEPHEYILSLATVDLDSLQSASGRKLFIAVGTGILRGEDIATRGRMLIYDVIKVIKEEGSSETYYKFKQLHMKSEKGPVTAFCSVNGYLLTAIGSKIIVHSFEDNSTLIGVAFTDVDTYVTTVSSIKNFIIVGDILKSVSFMCFQEDPYKLIMLGRDYHDLSIIASNFIVFGKSLGLTSIDSKGNIHVMVYSPDHLQSAGGQKLLRRGAIHTGRSPCKLIRIRRPYTPQPPATMGVVDTSRSNRRGCSNTSQEPALSDLVLIVNAEGGISILIPVTEKIYKRLHSIYSCMFSGLKHVAGLNPRGYRQVGQLEHPTIAANTVQIGSTPGARFTLDGDLIFEYFSLGLVEQTSIAKGIGSFKNRIIEDLIQVIKGTTLY